MKYSSLILFCLFALFSCKNGFLSSDVPEVRQDQKGTIGGERPVSTSTVTLKKQDIKKYLGDIAIGKRGELKAKLSLSLDYFPKTQVNRASLTQCYSPLDVNIQVAEIKCIESGVVKKVYASQILQHCKSKSLTYPAKSSINISDCQKVSFYQLEMESQISITIQPN